MLFIIIMNVFLSLKEGDGMKRVTGEAPIVSLLVTCSYTQRSALEQWVASSILCYKISGN